MSCCLSPEEKFRLASQVVDLGVVVAASKDVVQHLTVTKFVKIDITDYRLTIRASLP